MKSLGWDGPSMLDLAKMVQLVVYEARRECMGCHTCGVIMTRQAVFQAG